MTFCPHFTFTFWFDCACAINLIIIIITISNNNNNKYSELSLTHFLPPLALETLGPINCEGLSFISELGQRLRTTTGKMRETAFLFQRISITIQRFYAVAFKGTFAGQDTDEL